MEDTLTFSSKDFKITFLDFSQYSLQKAHHPSLLLTKNNNPHTLQQRKSLLNSEDLHKLELSPTLKKTIQFKRSIQRKFKALNKITQSFECQKPNDLNKIDRKMTIEIQEILIEGLKNHPLFTHLLETTLISMINKMHACLVTTDQFLIKQNDIAGYFFFLEQGKLKILSNNQYKADINPGTGFGEISLIFNSLNSASVVAIQPSIIWYLERATFLKFLIEINEQTYIENRGILDQLPFFKFFTDDQKDAIALNLCKQTFKKGDIIISQGEKAECFYIIQEGIVDILIDKKLVNQLKENDWFGESCFVEEGQRRGTAKAASETVVCLFSGVDELKELLGDSLKLLAWKNIARWGIEKSSTLKMLTDMQIFNLIDNMKIVSYKQGDLVFKSSYKKIIVLLEGRLKNKNGDIYADEGKCIGDNYLDKNINNDIEVEYLYMDLWPGQKQGILFEISEKELKKTLNFEFFSDILEENLSSHELLPFFSDSKEEYKIEDFIKEVEGEKQKNESIFNKIDGFCHFMEGHYAAVSLVNFEANLLILKSYDLKWLSKYKTFNQYVTNEEEVTRFCKFPFIMSNYLITTENDYKLFFLEYIRGLDLFEVLRRIGLLDKDQACFYIAGLVLILQYLHKNHIIYRDLKPDNIVIDTNGYPKLVDMGSSKFLGRSLSMFHSAGSFVSKLDDKIDFKSDSPYLQKSNNSSDISDNLTHSVHNVRTFTIIGTPHYMAPEIIMGQGYSFPVDYWALGILTYEFLCGYVPFGDDLEDPYEIYERIVKRKGKVKFPNYLTDNKAKLLITQLLSPSPYARLGGGFGKLKNHEFFNGFNWNYFMENKLNAPFIPKSGEDFQDDDEIKKKHMEESKLFFMDFLRKEHEYIKKNFI